VHGRIQPGTSKARNVLNAVSLQVALEDRARSRLAVSSNGRQACEGKVAQCPSRRCSLLGEDLLLSPSRDEYR
jgi:hypothetical protein